MFLLLNTSSSAKKLLLFRVEKIRKIRENLSRIYFISLRYEPFPSALASFSDTLLTFNVHTKFFSYSHTFDVSSNSFGLIRSMLMMTSVGKCA